MTPSGRIVRPMRMRPERPLEPMRNDLSISNTKGVNGKVKKRAKPPPVRARRRLIDPTKWDSAYLRGVFLDTVSIPLPLSKSVPEPPISVNHDIVEEEGEDETEEDGTDSDALSSIVRKEIKPPQHDLQLAHDRAYAMLSAQQSQVAALATTSRIHEATESIDVRDEANTALTMLGEMFGDKEEWDGRENVTEMDDLEDNEERDKEMQVDEDDIEIVPRDFGEGKGSKVIKDKGKGKDRSLREVIRFGHEDGVDVETTGGRDVEMEDVRPPINVEVSAQAAEPTPPTNLKALFAPREQGLSNLLPPCLVSEESCVLLASFSLLDHLDLDLDLELDADILGISAPSGASQENGHLSEPILPTPHVAFFPTTISTTKARSQVTLDPLLPLLFPSAASLLHLHTPSLNPTTTTHRHDTPSCSLFPSATRVRGLHHLPPNTTFTRSPQDTPESVREWWEENKSSLTHEWKKAWREARGSRRRKVGAGGEAGGGY